MTIICINIPTKRHNCISQHSDLTQNSALQTHKYTCTCKNQPTLGEKTQERFGSKSTDLL